MIGSTIIIHLKTVTGLILLPNFFFTLLSFHICRVYEKEGVRLVVDNISYDFVKGATIDYVEELIRSAFVVSETYLSLLLAHHFFLDLFIISIAVCRPLQIIVL